MSAGSCLPDVLEYGAGKCAVAGAPAYGNPSYNKTGGVFPACF